MFSTIDFTELDRRNDGSVEDVTSVEGSVASMRSGHESDNSREDHASYAGGSIPPTPPLDKETSALDQRASEAMPQSTPTPFIKEELPEEYKHLVQPELGTVSHI